MYFNDIEKMFKLFSKYKRTSGCIRYILKDTFDISINSSLSGFKYLLFESYSNLENIKYDNMHAELNICQELLDIKVPKCLFKYCSIM